MARSAARLKLHHLRPRHLALIAEAVMMLALAEGSLRLLPFRWTSRWLGPMVPPGSPEPAPPAPASGDPGDNEDAAASARKVGWAVRSVAERVPFRAVCLPQALAARAMLARRGIASTLSIGSAHGVNAHFDNHAWLDAAGVAVTGYPVRKGFACIGCYR